jgi:DNA-binding transcriptional MerR regulator
MFTVQQLARMAGVTRRTLHYYDEIGLLKPSRVGENGYRYYGEEALLRLQQILLYRELDLPLEEIRDILGRPDFNVLRALERHRADLVKRMAQLEQLVRTVDKTVLYLKGKKDMSQSQFFRGFSDAEQAAYEKEAEEKYGTDIVQASVKKWKGYSQADKERIGREGDAAYRAFLDAMPQGAASPAAQAAVELWRKHMDYFWTPNKEQLLGLANMYNDDPRFKANFDKINPNLANFVREAVRVYVNKNVDQGKGEGV